MRIKKLKRKQFLLQAGDIETHQTFVTSGCLRSYSIDGNGFEHILQFAPTNWWIGDINSVVTRTPATLYIDALFDSELILISRDDLEKVYKQIPSFERYFRILAENALVTHQRRLLDNLTLSAKDRYTNFCLRYPSLIQCLPQKYIAAYIGVTPEFLSKMLNSKQLSK
ncbi:Cyclic nucleotide-binding domain protein [compost metagenome]